MPEKKTVERAREAKREGKSPSTQAGEFVREEIHHIREGKHGASSPEQAIAIGLSKARRAGVDLEPPEKGEASEETRRQAKRDLKKGDQVVCGMQGVRVAPDVQSRDKPTFGFMSNEVSSERRVETSVRRVSELMRRVKASGGRIAFVAGPVVVHTGGSQYFCDLIERGYVDVLLSGNALAVHDIEVALSGTSLGIDLNSGHPVEHGHRNHMRAINTVCRAGGIGKAVESGVLTSGIMHACHTHGVQYILAGSIRDDGPLPETMMDLIEAQDAYGKALDGVEVVVMLSSMLHSIGVGNMLPSWVKVICVDINPAVVTKLSDRGSTQTIGIVTDVGLFLHQLAEQLKR